MSYEEADPTEKNTGPTQDILSTAPENPEPSSTDEPAPEKTAPEQNSSSVTTLQPLPPSSEVTNPDPPLETQPPIESAEPDDAPSEPPEDVPLYDPGEEDIPPTSPGEDNPVPPPTEPTDPPDGPEVDYPVQPKPPTIIIPEISAYYAYEDGQHIVYLTNGDTGETSPINLTSFVTENGYYGTHNLFGYMIEVSLIPISGDDPLSNQPFYLIANVIM